MLLAMPSPWLLGLGPQVYLLPTGQSPGCSCSLVHHVNTGVLKGSVLEPGHTSSQGQFIHSQRLNCHSYTDDSGSFFFPPLIPLPDAILIFLIFYLDDFKFSYLYMSNTGLISPCSPKPLTSTTRSPNTYPLLHGLSHLATKYY